jgi:glycosyltransferase involved in cell wall biosynthesis
MSIYVNARFLTQSITGVQRYAIELSKIIKDKLPNIKFVAPKSIVQKELAEYLDVEPIGRFTGHIWEQFELPLFLQKKNKPLLINFCNTAPLFYNKQIVTIHDLSFLISPEWFSKPFYRYYSFLIPRIANNSLMIVTPSKHSKNDLVQILNLKEDKIKVIHNSIPDNFKKFDVGHLINQYGKYVLAVSSLDPRKNFTRLIEAFTRANLPDTKLVLVGTSNKIFADQKLQQAIHNNSSVVFTGYVSDDELINLYKHANLFVYPSLYEGFGIPPLEAMACGCPTIVSKTSSLPEVCGEASYYIDPYNVEEIRQAILKLTLDVGLVNKLRLKGLERVKHFDWNKSADQLIKVIQQCSSTI